MNVRVLDGRGRFRGMAKTTAPMLDLVGKARISIEWFVAAGCFGNRRYVLTHELHVDEKLRPYIKVKWKERERLKRAGVLTDTLD